MTSSWIRPGLIIVFLTLNNFIGRSQSDVPDILSNGTLKEQTGYIKEKTRIYENYRAIREDMFQKIMGNALDSLAAARKEIFVLKTQAGANHSSIDSLNISLAATMEKLDEAFRTKDSMRLLGFEINKITYNSVMWILILLLIGILVSGFLAFRRNRAVTIHTKKEFEDLKKEFEAYRKSSREAREKMSMTHFNELRKLRGG